MSMENAPVICAVENGVVIATVLVPQIRDPQVVDTLRSTMLQAIDSSNARSVIVSLRDVKFMMSMAFLAFMAVRRRMGEGRVVLCDITPEIAEILSLCRLIPTEKMPSAPFEVASSLSDARERCGLV